MSKTILAQRAEDYSILPDYLPDAITDTKSKRQKNKKKAENLSRRLETAAIYKQKPLNLLTVPIGVIDPLDLYGAALHALARQLCADIVGKHPHYAKLERGRHGWAHLHIITTATMPDDVAGGHSTPITDTAGAISYLQKPADARACMTKNEAGHWQQTRPADKLAALETLQLAQRERDYQRLPTFTWSGNLPKYMRPPL